MRKNQVSFITMLAIIVICIIVLLRTSFTQYSEQKNLQSASNQMTANNLQLAKLDTISMGLQDAENNFRMYTSIWDRQYFLKYSKQMRHISTILESFSKKESSRVSDEITADLSKKKEQIILYTRIKKLTDSLMMINLELDTAAITQSSAFSKPVLQAAIKKTVKIEALKTTPGEKKSRLFQRIKSAILNKSTKADTAETRKVETTFESIPDGARYYTQRQVDQIERFYRNLLESQKQNHKNLTEKERAILKLNEQILQNIKLLFREFSYKEHLDDQNRKTTLRKKSSNALAAINRSGKINFIINIFSILMIAFLLIKLYKAYHKIVNANQTAEEQATAKSRFFTSISHEMRTPLNAIIGVTEQLKSTPLNTVQQEMSVLLESSSAMLLSAVNEILDFTRLETGKVSLSRIPFLYKKLLSEMVASLHILASQKGLELIIHQQDTADVMLLGDPYRLKQIVVNLIANAIKFTDDGRVTVDVKLGQTDGQHTVLLIRITDTGIGIDEKDLPYIFDEFSQIIHTKRVDWQKGSGLGLPICKKLIELHEGKITVDSTMGKGTTFHIELPYSIANDQEKGSDAKALPALQTEIFKQIHLLVVDDAEMNLLVIKMIFNKLGISYDTAHNGEDALIAIEKNSYDMVLTDIEMPVIDGIELTKTIRRHSDPKIAMIPVIAITGQISPESHKKYISSGLNDYIIKPFKEKELLEKILDYLA